MPAYRDGNEVVVNEPDGAGGFRVVRYPAAAFESSRMRGRRVGRFVRGVWRWFSGFWSDYRENERER